MSQAYGVLTLGDASLPLNSVSGGQAEVWKTAQQYLADYVEDVQDVSRALVERVTEDYKTRYYLPGGGAMQRRGGQAQSHAIRPYGYWDVALPIEEFGDQVAGTRNALAKMTLQKLQVALDTVRVRNMNARKFEMMRAIFNNTVKAFPDDDYGTLNVQPLAIVSDGVLYPPLQGTTDETTLESYYESGYAASAISDANNPILFIGDKLRARFGDSNNICVFIHLDQHAKVELLLDFDEVADPFIRTGGNTDVAVGAPANVAGTIVGRCNNCWVAVWSQVPTGYVFGMDLDQPRPLLERRQPASVGIPYGLHLETRSSDAANYPWDQAHYEDHFGFGVGNRLNGVVVELASAGTYTIPPIYV